MFELINNEARQQYEFRIGSNLAKIDYRIRDGKIYLMHTEVPDMLSGQGIGTELVESVLKDIQQRKLILVPWCPFVLDFLKRNPEGDKLRIG